MRSKRLLTAACVMAVLAVTGCGGHYSSGTADSDFEFEVSKGAGYQKTGAFTQDEYGMTTWHQYAYDEEGNLVSERANFDGVEGYGEITYDENGDMKGNFMYDGAGNVTMGTSYTYDYDESGNKTARYAEDVNGTEPMLDTEYVYGDGGYIEKSIVHYNWSDTYSEEYMFDENGNITSFVSYDSGVEQGHASYEYDEHGNMISETYFNNMIGGEVTFTYENEYDDDGNLISSTSYYPDGSVRTSTENVYAEIDGNEGYFTLDDIRNHQAIMNGEDVTPSSGTTLAGNVDYAQIHDKIRNGETIFTFGYKSSEYMHLSDIVIEGTSHDADGDYCAVKITYDSGYGQLTFGGKVYYVMDGEDLIITKCVDNVSAAASNAVKDLTALSDPNYVDPYVYYGRYCRFERDDYGNAVFPNDGNHYFSSGFPGGYEYKVNGNVQEQGYYMTAPSDMVVDYHSYDFTLTTCVNGLCKTYYCRTLIEKEVFYMAEIDEMTGEIISQDMWISEASIGNGDTVNRILNAE